MCVTGKVFGKISLKSTRGLKATTFLIYGLWSGKGQVGSNFWCGMVSNREG